MFADYEKIARPTLGESAKARIAYSVQSLRKYGVRVRLPARPWLRGILIRIGVDCTACSSGYENSVMALTVHDRTAPVEQGGQVCVSYPHSLKRTFL